jgi:hypothetical protein
MSIKRSIVPDFIGFKLNTRNILSTLAIKFWFVIETGKERLL